MATFAGWEQAVLRLIRAPVTATNVQLLDAWQRAEGGGAANNPLNTTQPAAGASDYNGVGVKNYPTPTIGANATARTLLGNASYAGLVADLRKGSVAPQQILARNQQAFSTWGTGSSSIERVLGGTVSSIKAALSLLKPASGVNISGVDPSLLGRLAALASATGKQITITSGYRTPDGSVAAGGSASDPHTTGLAVDATIGGRPIADVIPVATIQSFGLISGDQAGFWPGHDAAYPRSSSDPAGADPVHVQLPANEKTAGFNPTAAANNVSLGSALNGAAGWLERHVSILPGMPGPIAGVIPSIGDITSIGGSANPLNWPGEITGWIESKIGYALIYAALVMFSIVLAIFGLLSLLGIKPRTVVTTVGTRAAVAAA